MSTIFTLLLLATAAIVGCHAQSSTATVYVEDSTHVGPYTLFSTQFVGVKLDTNGEAWVTWVSGDIATYGYELTFYDQVRSSAFGGSYQYSVKIGATGTYWVYAAEAGTTYNFDWLEIRVVANSFSGTITPVYGTEPSGFWSGYPPNAVYGMIAADHPVVPASTPAPTNYVKWLVPLLAVVIVTALAVPLGMYIRKRRQQNKAERAAQRDAAATQMTSLSGLLV